MASLGTMLVAKFDLQKSGATLELNGTDILNTTRQLVPVDERVFATCDNEQRKFALFEIQKLYNRLLSTHVAQLSVEQTREHFSKRVFSGAGGVEGTNLPPLPPGAAVEVELAGS